MNWKTYNGGKIMDYFSKITDNYWTPKNKAHEEVLDFIKQFDGALIKDEDTPRFINRFSAGISRINHKHARCNNLILQYSQLGDNDLWLRISGVFNLVLYKVKYEFDKI